MEMVHGLAAVLPGIHDDAVAAVKLLGLGDLRRRRKKVTEQRGILSGGIAERTNMLSRHNQHMHRRLGVDIREGVAKIVLEDGRRGNNSFNDFAEEAAHSDLSVHALLSIGE